MKPGKLWTLTSVQGGWHWLCVAESFKLPLTWFNVGLGVEGITLCHVGRSEKCRLYKPHPCYPVSLLLLEPVASEHVLCKSRSVLSHRTYSCNARVCYRWSLFSLWRVNAQQAITLATNFQVPLTQCLTQHWLLTICADCSSLVLFPVMYASCCTFQQHMSDTIHEAPRPSRLISGRIPFKPSAVCTTITRFHQQVHLLVQLWRYIQQAILTRVWLSTRFTKATQYVVCKTEGYTRQVDSK